jgi:AcrR family transcriptional regulator
MEAKMDRRQRKTREAIFTAFSSLLCKKDFHKMTVGEIIKEADVGRATFYSHFETKEYLLKSFCEELFCHVFDTAGEKNNSHRHIFDCDGEESLFLHLLKHLSNNDNNVIKYRKNNGFFELIFDHGKGNTSNGALVNNKYAYSYLPEATSEETELYAADPDAFLIAYTPTAHAVLEKKLGIVAANFFEDGTNAAVSIKGTNTQYTALTKLEADTPSSVLVTKGENGEYTISVSDPTQIYRQTVVTATFTGITELVSADSGAEVEIEDGVVYITINTANACGKTFNITVK